MMEPVAIIANNMKTFVKKKGFRVGQKKVVL